MIPKKPINMQEIERKFLVTSEAFKLQAFKQQKVVQGYLNSNPARAVRIRIKGDQGYLTIKGKSEDGGISRFEWEKEIPLNEAETLLKLCEPSIIKKTRFLVKFKEHVFEIDEFYGENEGLTVAEIELTTVDEKFEKPKWIGQEITGNKKYYNSQLSRHPFKNW